MDKPIFGNDLFIAMRDGDLVIPQTSYVEWEEYSKLQAENAQLREKLEVTQKIVNAAIALRKSEITPARFERLIELYDAIEEYEATL